MVTKRSLKLAATFTLLFAMNASAFMAIGHRGVRRLEDENTIAAMRLALERGADGIETDVRLTSDGVPVIMHDPWLDRTTGGSGRVRGVTAEEFAKLRTDRGHTPPTLKEVLDELGDRDITIFLEIKRPGPDVLEALDDVLSRYDGKAEIALFSTSADFIETAQERMPLVKTYFSPVHPYRPEKTALAHDLDGLLVVDFYITKGLVKRAHAAGLPVIASMVDGEGNLARVMEKGVDGALLNDPAIAGEEAIKGRCGNDSATSASLYRNAR